MNRRLLAITITIGLAAGAFAQQTQTLRDRDPDLSAAKKLAADMQQANFHRDTFYLVSRIRIADAGFSEGAYVPTGDNEGGPSLKIEAPQRLYFVPRKKTVYSLEFVPGYNFFREGEQEGQFDYLLRGDAHFLFNHLYLDVYGIRSDQLEAHVADINRLATAREGEYGIGGEVKYSSRTSGQFIVRMRDTEYPQDRFQPDPETIGPHIPTQVLNRRERNARVSLLHKTFPRTSLFVAAEGSDYNFDNVAAYSSRRTYVGGGLQYTGRFTASLEAGPTKLDFDNDLVRDYDGITARLRVSRSAGRWTYALAGDHDIGFSLFLANPYFIATSGNLGVDYSANRRLTLHARTAYERDEFETPVQGQLRTDRISFTSVGFTYGLRRIQFGADIGWHERDSTAFGDESSGIRYALRLSFVP